MKILSHVSEKKKEKGFRVLTGFQILRFHWSFSSDNMAVKGLKTLPGHIGRHMPSSEDGGFGSVRLLHTI